MEVVKIESSICKDGIVRLKNPEIIDVASTITPECLRFSHVNRETALEKGILAIIDSLITACEGSGLLEIRDCARRLKYIREDGVLDLGEWERLMRRAMAAFAKKRKRPR